MKYKQSHVTRYSIECQFLFRQRYSHSSRNSYHLRILIKITTLHVMYDCFYWIFSVAGISRSVTITAAYIMSVTDINHQEAFQVIRSARNAANPNIGFQRQLYEFETSGTRHKVLYLWGLTIDHRNTKPLLISWYH